MSADPRDQRIAELERQIGERDVRIARLEAALDKALTRIAALEARLGQNSSNSNQPPSKDTPEQRRNREKAPPSGRKRGGQPGHKPQQREMLPPEKVGRIEDHHPHECEQCGSVLAHTDDPTPLRRQVIDLPEIRIRSGFRVADTRAPSAYLSRRCRSDERSGGGASPGGAPAGCRRRSSRPSTA